MTAFLHSLPAFLPRVATVSTSSRTVASAVSGAPARRWDRQCDDISAATLSAQEYSLALSAFARTINAF